MNRRSKKTQFEFIPIVKELLNLLVKPDSPNREQEIIKVSQDFLQKMEDAQKALASAPGLDMTEEEQEQKIAELQEAISNKKKLLEDCNRCFESWEDDE